MISEAGQQLIDYIHLLEYALEGDELEQERAKCELEYALAEVQAWQDLADERYCEIIRLEAKLEDRSSICKEAT